jgi:peptidoglycan/xylan/chitin deacetylase (PgdA/CDA1 family)
MKANRITGDVYSLVFHTSKVAGKASRQDAVKVFNIHMNQERFLQIDDILHLKKENVKGIRKVVREQVQNNKEIKADVLKELATKPEKWQWSVNREYFSIYTKKAAVADIPIQKIDMYLNKDVDKFLKIRKERKIKKEKIIQEEQLKLDPNGKYIALTFDDGPSPEVTPRILKALKEHGAKATFFMLGNQVAAHPALARKVAEDGHEIGNHSRSHSDLSKKGPGKIKAEMDFTKEKIKEAAGVSVHLIRPPYGAYGDCLLEYAEKSGDAIILWSVDSLDWKSKNAAFMQDIILKMAAPGGIILMHDIHPPTADSLPKILTVLKNEGYQFVTVSQLLNLQQEKGTGPFFGVSKNKHQ